MEVGRDIIHYKDRQDYLSKGKSGVKKLTSNPKSNEALLNDKVNISKGAQIKNKVKDTSKEVGKSLAQNNASGAIDLATSVASKIMKPSIPDVPDIKADVEPKKEVKKVEENKKIKLINKPAIFFISGLDLFSGSSDDNGIKAMSEMTPGAEHFEYDEVDDLVEQIKKRPRTQPVIIVGHSLGGDTALEVANELNTLENGFRPVDLVVTLDSVGINNDIVPTNVKKNLNFIGSEDMFLNDAPNIARDTNMTEVLNELRTESHRDLDNSEAIQQKILEGIDIALKSNKLLKT